jgi:hypothetical protein
MYELLDRLERLTKTMVEELENTGYERLLSFLDERNILIEQLLSFAKEDFTVDSRIQAQYDRIVSYNPMILARINELKAEAETGLSKASIGRKQKLAYDVDFATDSLFYDKKK